MIWIWTWAWVWNELWWDQCLVMGPAFHPCTHKYWPASESCTENNLEGCFLSSQHTRWRIYQIIKSEWVPGWAREWAYLHLWRSGNLVTVAKLLVHLQRCFVNSASIFLKCRAGQWYLYTLTMAEILYIVWHCELVVILFRPVGHYLLTSPHSKPARAWKDSRQSRKEASVADGFQHSRKVSCFML